MKNVHNFLKIGLRLGIMTRYASYIPIVGSIMLKESFAQGFINQIIARPWRSITLTIFIVFAFLPGLAKFAEKYDVRIWFLENDPNIKVLNYFEREFGNDENVVLVLHSPSGIFRPENARILSEMTQKAWLFPQVIRVESLSNYNYTYAQGDEVIIEPFFQDKEYFEQKYLTERKKIALNHRVMPGYLLGHDAKTALIFCRLIVTPGDSPQYDKIVKAAEELIQKYKGQSDLQFHILGEGAVNDAFRYVANDDAALIIPILLLLITVFLFYTFRSITAVFLPMVVIALSTLSTFGIGFSLGIEYNTVLSILPAILIAIGVADSVHFITSYFQFRALGKKTKESTFDALKKNFLPTLLTTISTMIGFFSLLKTDLVPIRNLGLLAGIGCFFAWVLTIGLIAPLLSLIDFKVPATFEKTKKEKGASPLVSSFVRFIQIQRRWIIFVFLILTVLSFYLSSKNIVNSSPYTFFSKETPIRKANDFILKNFGGNSGPEFIIHSGKVDGIKDPNFLSKVEKFKERIESHSFVNKTVDIVDIIKDLNKSFHEGDEQYYRIPDDRKKIAELLFLYTMSLPEGMDIKDRVTLKNDAIRLSIIWELSDTRGWLSQVDKFEKIAKELGLNVQSTGKFLLFQRLLDYLIATFFTSILMAFVLVALMMSILFSSIKLGLFSLLPNLLPLIYGGAAMYLFGMDLNIGTALVASVCLGIAVDDTIHFLTNYYRMIKQGKSPEEALLYIYSYTGKALIITTVILVICFALFMLGHFVPNVNFGILCSVVLSLALIVDLIFLPALLLSVDRKAK